MPQWAVTAWRASVHGHTRTLKLKQPNRIQSSINFIIYTCAFPTVACPKAWKWSGIIQFSRKISHIHCNCRLAKGHFAAAAAVERICDSSTTYVVCCNFSCQVSFGKAFGSKHCNTAIETCWYKPEILFISSKYFVVNQSNFLCSFWVVEKNS